MYSNKLVSSIVIHLLHILHNTYNTDCGFFFVLNVTNNLFVEVCRPPISEWRLITKILCETNNTIKLS